MRAVVVVLGVGVLFGCAGAPQAVVEPEPCVCAACPDPVPAPVQPVAVEPASDDPRLIGRDAPVGGPITFELSYSGGRKFKITNRAAPCVGARVVVNDRYTWETRSIETGSSKFVAFDDLLEPGSESGMGKAVLDKVSVQCTTGVWSHTL